MRARLGWKIGAVAAIVLLVGAQAWAQRQPQNPQQGQQVQQGQQLQQGQATQRQQRTTLRAQQGVESMADHEIAAWLILANEAEVALAQWASQKAEDNQVKQFADAMAKEHPNLINQLRQFAPDAPTLQVGQATGQREGKGQNSQQEQLANQPQQQPAPQTQTGQVQGQRQANQGLPFLQVCSQIAERNLAGLEKELGEKKGSHFDHAFMGTQMMSHLAMYNTMEVLRPYASPQLQNVIDQGIQTTRSHWQQAKQACEALDKNTTKTSDTDRGDNQ